MPDYSEWITPTKQQFREERPDYVERPRINYQQAIRDLLDHLQNYPASTQHIYASGMYIALIQTNPWLAERFLEGLRSQPLTADTADTILETVYFASHADSKEK